MRRWVHIDILGWGKLCSETRYGIISYRKVWSVFCLESEILDAAESAK